MHSLHALTREVLILCCPCGVPVSLPASGLLHCLTEHLGQPSLLTLPSFLLQEPLHCIACFFGDMGLMRFQMALNFWSFSAHLHGAEIKRMCHRAQFCQWLPPLSCGLILKFELPVARFPYFPSSTLIFTEHFMFSQLSEWFQQLPWNQKLISGPSKF